MAKKFSIKSKTLAPILLVVLFVLLAIVIYYLVYKRNCNCTENFSNTLVLEIYTAPWCGHCKKFEEGDKIQQIKNELGASNVKHYQDQDEGCAENMTKHDLNGFPSIILTRNGVKEQTYSSERTVEGVCNFYRQYS
tara:strand:- start:15370 stop:15777 length:408 start_codon:yes stop_codon:yes gene_type:complete